MTIDFGKLKELAKDQQKSKEESKNEILHRVKKNTSAYNDISEDISTKRAHVRKVNNGVTLTDEQYNACREIEAWYFDSKDEYKTLSGYAGTGKTTSLDAIVDVMVRNNLKVLVTATTNKAVKVLKEKIKHPASHFRTIHSALNIVPKQIGEREVFEPAFGEKFIIEDYDIVIIDECSMISELLLSYIDEAIERSYSRKTKVLFCGDPAQLQPINEDLSTCFEFNEVKLENIIRHGDVIAQKSKLVRSTDEYIPFDNLIAEPDISYIDIDSIKEMAKGFRDNPDRVRLLCWTNRGVHRWNQLLRLADYGEKTKYPYIVGDILMANEPCIDRAGDIVMMNSEEGKVIDMKPAQNSYYVTLLLDSGKEAEVCIIRDKYKPKLKGELKKLADEAKAGNKKKWREYWALRKSFHDVRHCYALTAHKSQGSTFQHIIMDVDDINQNKKVEERNQLIYVAMTRASDNVWIFE